MLNIKSVVSKVLLYELEENEKSMEKIKVDFIITSSFVLLILLLGYFGSNSPATAQILSCDGM